MPDADMLIRIAEIFEINVSELFGIHIKGGVEEATTANIAEKLSRINEQLTIKNQRSHRIWKMIVIATVILLNILLVTFYIMLRSIAPPTEIQQTEEVDSESAGKETSSLRLAAYIVTGFLKKGMLQQAFLFRRIIE